MRHRALVRRLIIVKALAPRQRRQSIVASFSPAIFDNDLTPFDKVRFIEAAEEFCGKGAFSLPEEAPRKPTTGIAVCCAPADSDQVAAAPPKSVINSRRLIASPKAQHRALQERRFSTLVAEAPGRLSGPAMSPLVQSLLICDVRVASVHPSISDMMLHPRERRNGPLAEVAFPTSVRVILLLRADIGSRVMRAVSCSTSRGHAPLTEGAAILSPRRNTAGSTMPR
jgi:hypothetical protein